MIYLFYGQPASGKTTISKEFIQLMNFNKYIHIDGDNIRDILKNYDYSKTGREINIKSVFDITKFMDNLGYDIIISIVAPYKKERFKLKETNNVIDIYLYTNEIRGREKFFVKDFEIPIDSTIIFDTSKKTVIDSAKQIINLINEQL